MARVLVVDDEHLQRDILRTILTDGGYETHTAASGSEALKLIRKLQPHVVLTDLKMEGLDGIELLDAAVREGFETSIIIMTAYGTISSAVEAVKKGAFDYLTKPLDRDVLLLTVKRAAERVSLIKENLLLHNELYGRFKLEGIIGRSPTIRKAIDIMKKVIQSPVTVLIRGESGTGKELVARAIHYNSQRRTKPFTALNCSAIPENLFESELFGYEPGAFTGATARKDGLFEISDGGTIFLDEIGDLPLSVQSKLLRILQDKEVRRIGGKESKKIDVRIITATNKDLERELGEGHFREDLYFRLKVFTIELPPLRERMEDIPELAEFFVGKYNREFGRRIRTIEPEAMEALTAYIWPGNIRELESVIERAVLMNEGGVIRLTDIRNELVSGRSMKRTGFDLPDEGINLEEMEKELINRAMEKSGGVATKAARLLGMSYKSFLYRLEKIRSGDPNKR